MDKLVETIADRIPEADGGLRRRLTAGTLISVCLAYAVYIRLSKLDNNSDTSFFDFLNKLTGALPSVFDKPFTAILISLGIFAIGRLVEIFAELSFREIFGAFVNKSSGEPPKFDREFWKWSRHLDADGGVGAKVKAAVLQHRQQLYQTMGVVVRVPIVSGIVLFIAQIFGLILLLAVFLIRTIFVVLISPLLFLIRRFNLLSKYDVEIRSILTEDFVLTKQQAETLKFKPGESPLEIARNPFSRDFETLWEFIKINLQTVQSTETMRRERNFRESLTIVASIVVGFALIIFIADPLNVYTKVVGWNQAVLLFGYVYAVLVVFVVSMVLIFQVKHDLIIFALRLLRAQYRPMTAMPLSPPPSILGGLGLSRTIQPPRSGTGSG